jgi:hypothetical protein
MRTNDEKIEYWKNRCTAAEELIRHSNIKPNDNDKTLTRLYCSWIGFKYKNKM